MRTYTPRRCDLIIDDETAIPPSRAARQLAPLPVGGTRVGRLHLGVPNYCDIAFIGAGDSGLQHVLDIFTVAAVVVPGRPSSNPLTSAAPVSCISLLAVQVLKRCTPFMGATHRK